MKLLKLVLVVALMLLVMPQAMAGTYTIDGDLSDWGLGKLYTDDWSLNETWLPLPSSNITFVVEDNADPRYANNNPYAIGVHIKGIGSYYEAYEEPLLVNVNDGTKTIAPTGGPAGNPDYYDLEAMYVDENDTMIFVAIVISSQSLDWGDLALDLDGDGMYEYGVKLSNVPGGVSQVGIYKTPTADCWVPAWYMAPEDGPFIVKINMSNPSVTLNGTAVVAYNNSGIYDYGGTNYFVEIAIPKDAVGMSGKRLPDPPLPKKIYFPENCGNDSGGIVIPEFPALLIPLGVILGTIYFFRRGK